MKTLKSIFESDIPKYINEGINIGEGYDLYRIFMVEDYFLKSAFDYAKLKSYLNKNKLFREYEYTKEYSKTTANRLNLIGSLIDSVNIDGKIDIGQEKQVALLIKDELNKFSNKHVNVELEMGHNQIKINVIGATTLAQFIYDYKKY